MARNLGFAMKTFVHRAEFAIGDVGINLSRGDTTVAKQELNGAQVRAVTEEIGGETMTQSVRCNWFCDAGINRIKMD